MDFPFDIQKHLPLDHQGFAVLDTTSQQPRNTGVSTTTYNRGPTYMSQDSTKSCLAQIIDKMGEASSRVIKSLFIFSFLDYIGARPWGDYYKLWQIHFEWR